MGLRRGTYGGGSGPRQQATLHGDGTQRFFAQSMVLCKKTAAGFLRAETPELLFEMLDEREQQGIRGLEGTRAGVLQHRMVRVWIASEQGQVLVG